MKKTVERYVFLFSVFIIPFFASSQIVNDFELGNGNRESYELQCWQFDQMQIEPSANIEGIFGAITPPINSSSDTFRLISPWVSMDENSQIQFKHKLLEYQAGVKINVGLIDGSGLRTEMIHHSEYSHGHVKEEALLVPESGIYQLIFEWFGTGNGSKACIDRIVIGGAMQSDMTTNNGSGNCQLLSLSADSDNDGVIDSEDDYPHDVYKAYNINYFGDAPISLAFEDNWPSLGDFDFNDLVLDASLKFVTNANDQMVELHARFVVRAIGAKFVNGFGFQLKGVAPSAVMDVTGSLLTEDIISIAGNGLEAGQSAATVIVFDNPFPLLPHPGGGTGVNTRKSATFVEPVKHDIVVTFMDEGVSGGGQPMYYSSFIMQSEAFNPFIFINGVRGREVHLPGFSPTDLADKSFYGDRDDDTQPESGKFYVSKNNLPWGIMVPQSFDYPVEKQSIVGAYLKFGSWAQSNGAVYKNWYENLPGFRDEKLIY